MTAKVISVDGTDLRNGCFGNTPHIKRARMCESFSFLVPGATGLLAQHHDKHS